ncbi:MAG TPA: efflux RND transporter periplasmic adaptor subunit [Candidatus Acidoferrum sp.]|jgi:HlyD family secretion protein|nr:efflux RND transporter periplasmic adaptor subunit [Candidatus Acidoferrum sp.]
MRTWISLIIILTLGAGGYYGWRQYQKNQLTSAAPGRPTTAIAELRDINFAVNAAGEIAPAEQVSVRPEINGLLLTLPVDIGDRVKKDQLLFKLDDSELQQQRASNLTDIEKAKLGVEKADRDYQRAKQLLSEKLISQEVYDDTKTAYDLAKNALESAQKVLAITEERLTKTEVRAPFDCTVLTRPVSVGQAVSGSGGFNSGTEVLTIADLNSMIINAQVNQADVPRLKVGETVQVTVEAVTGLLVTGMVERLSPQATIRNNIKGYPARIALRNVDPRVRPGMTANVRIPVASADQVTAVPLSAVFTERNPETGQMERYVYVAQGDRLERRNVTVGVSDYFYAEIQDGLKPGEIVSLELPKDELEKIAQQLAVQKPGGDQGAPAAKSGAVPGISRTNTTTLGTTGASPDISSNSLPASATPARAAGKS